MFTERSLKDISDETIVADMSSRSHHLPHRRHRPTTWRKERELGQCGEGRRGAVRRWSSPRAIFASRGGFVSGLWPRWGYQIGSGRFLEESGAVDTDWSACKVNLTEASPAHELARRGRSHAWPFVACALCGNKQQNTKQNQHCPAL